MLVRVNKKWKDKLEQRTETAVANFSRPVNLNELAKFTPAGIELCELFFTFSHGSDFGLTFLQPKQLCHDADAKLHILLYQNSSVNNFQPLISIMFMNLCDYLIL